VGAEKLSAAGVSNTFQLLAKFMGGKSEGSGQQATCDAFFHCT
jgi:hypothetical protein